MRLNSLEAYWAKDSNGCLIFFLRTRFTAEKFVWSGVRKWEKWENTKFDDDLELARWMWSTLTCRISIVKSSTNNFRISMKCGFYRCFQIHSTMSISRTMTIGSWVLSKLLARREITSRRTGDGTTLAWNHVARIECVNFLINNFSVFF